MIDYKKKYLKYKNKYIQAKNIHLQTGGIIPDRGMIETLHLLRIQFKITEKDIIDNVIIENKPIGDTYPKLRQWLQDKESACKNKYNNDNVDNDNVDNDNLFKNENVVEVENDVKVENDNNDNVHNDNVDNDNVDNDNLFKKEYEEMNFDNNLFKKEDEEMNFDNNLFKKEDDVEVENDVNPQYKRQRCESRKYKSRLVKYTSPIKTEYMNAEDRYQAWVRANFDTSKEAKQRFETQDFQDQIIGIAIIILIIGGFVISK